MEKLDTNDIIGETTTSVTSSVAGVGLIVVLTLVGIACALSLGKNVKQKILLNN